MSLAALFLILLVIDQANDDKVNDFIVYFPLFIMLIELIFSFVNDHLDKKKEELEEELDFQMRRKSELRKRKKVIERQKQKFGEKHE